MNQEGNWMLVRCGTRYHFMFRDETNLYLAELGRYRNRKLEYRYAGAVFSVESAEMTGLNCEKIPLSGLRGAAIGGVEKGDAIYLYPSAGSRRTLFLAESVSREWLEALFREIPRFTPPMDKRKRKQDPDFWRKERQDPEIKRKLKPIPFLLAAAGVGFTAGYHYYETPIWFFGCIACMLLPLILVIVMPAYFTFVEKSPKKQKRYGISLAWPVMLTWFLMMPTVLNYSSRDHWKVIVFAGILTLTVGTVLALFAEEFRRDKWNLWVLLIVFVFGIGIVCAANETLETEDPQMQYVQVQKLEHRRRTKGIDSFYCTVSLPDGTTDRLEVYGSTYIVLEEGETVILALYPGGLGIPYREILPIS